MRVLVIEDNDDHYALIEDALLSESFSDVNIQHEQDLCNGLRSLTQESFDICLCDLQLPDASIDTTVENLNGLQTATPIIVLTSLNSIETAKDLLQHDVQDYLPKEDLSAPLLSRMCAYAIERKHQQRLLQNRNSDMQIFCSSLSHDFKAHVRRLNSISMLLQEKLEEHIELDPEELNWFQLIQNSTLGISELVDGLGQFLLVDHQDDQHKRVSLQGLFQDLRATIVAPSEQALDIIIHDDIPKVQGHESQLYVLFHNIVTNGIKYCETSPRIEIRGVANPETGYDDISISDNGIGIESRYLSQIFLPFRRLHNAQQYSGSGLGLSIVKRIADKHEAKIHVDSEPGKGSTFVISFPMVR